jgi:hypothetical protein
MGIVANIAMDKFPAQAKGLRRRTEVRFIHDLEHTIGGTIVRDDIEEPYRTIIKLDDGRYVLATECQYSYPE